MLERLGLSIRARLGPLGSVAGLMSMANCSQTSEPCVAPLVSSKRYKHQSQPGNWEFCQHHDIFHSRNKIIAGRLTVDRVCGTTSIELC